MRNHSVAQFPGSVRLIPKQSKAAREERASKPASVNTHSGFLHTCAVLPACSVRKEMTASLQVMRTSAVCRG